MRAGDSRQVCRIARSLPVTPFARFPFQQPQATIEVEADTLEQVGEALAAGADIILLDNMTIDEMRESVRRCAGRALTEASGGITPENIAEVSSTGVDLISLGALTHSAPSLDISLELELAG